MGSARCLAAAEGKALASGRACRVAQSGGALLGGFRQLAVVL